MNGFRAVDPADSLAQLSLDNISFYIAITEHTLRNLSAMADSMIAAAHGGREAGDHLLDSMLRGFHDRLAAASALSPGALFAAPWAIATRALERRRASARAFCTTLMTGAMACREPLLERLETGGGAPRR